jgi:hypothetical protein
MSAAVDTTWFDRISNTANKVATFRALMDEARYSSATRNGPRTWYMETSGEDRTKETRIDRNRL